jgi:serine/threonine protein kinase
MGTFGKVYLAQETQTERKFAIKMINSRKLRANVTKTDIETLITEVNILRRIWHPYLVMLHEVYFEELSVYLVLEYVPSGNLKQRLIKRGGRIAEFS